MPKLLLLGPLLCFLASQLLVAAQASTQYWIPVYPQPTAYPGRVGVVIPSNPKWAHDALIDAMVIWNQEQFWFKDTYFPNEKIYNLTESSTGIRVEYVNGVCCGWTQPFSPGGVLVQIALSYENKSLSRLDVTIIAEHEIGHALGLAHTKVTGHLMNGDHLVIPKSGLPLPSTLDLYALAVLSTGLNTRYNICLPSDIPYTVPETAAPEVPMSYLLLVACVGLVVAFSKRRRQVTRDLNLKNEL